MTDLQQSANLLTRLNRWRTGGRGEMPDPREITAAIDAAILALKFAQAAKEWGLTGVDGGNDWRAISTASAAVSDFSISRCRYRAPCTGE